MKIVRLGNTESHLLLSYYVIKYTYESDTIKMQFDRMFMSFANWLYSSAGYYDKDVKGTPFNFDKTAITPKFLKYINELETAIGNCEETQFYFPPNIFAFLKKHEQHFLQVYKIKKFKLLNETRFNDRVDQIYDFMKHKKVLIVSSFDGLIQKQYDSGNVYKIYPKFPQLQSLDTVKFPYCFCNDGPHQDYFETQDYIFDLIKEKDFDIAILGCGSYGHMLCHRIDNDLKKDAIYVGGNIQEMFGILCEREKNAGFIKPNEFWITDIPKEYRPTNFKLVENGCYW